MNHVLQKVLIIGPEFWHYNLSIDRAFKQHGYETRLISYREIRRFSHYFSYIKHFFKRAKIPFGIKEINIKIIVEYEQFNPDIVFIVRGTSIYRDTLERMNKSILILWTMDSIFSYKYKGILANVDQLNYVYSFENTDVVKLKEIGVKADFLPMALDEKVYFPMRHLKKDIDVSFIGSLYDDRLETLYKIMKELKGYNLKFYGKRLWVKNKPFKYFFNREVFPNETLTPEKVNELYNRSKICLNMHKEQSKYGVNPRFFEIYGTCSLQIVNENPYIKEKYNPKNLITYINDDELIQLLKKHIIRAQSSDLKNVYDFTVQNHTFYHRIGKVLGDLNF